MCTLLVLTAAAAAASAADTAAVSAVAAAAGSSGSCGDCGGAASAAERAQLRCDLRPRLSGGRAAFCGWCCGPAAGPAATAAHRLADHRGATTTVRRRTTTAAAEWQQQCSGSGGGWNWTRLGNVGASEGTSVSASVGAPRRLVADGYGEDRASLRLRLLRDCCRVIEAQIVHDCRAARDPLRHS